MYISYLIFSFFQDDRQNDIFVFRGRTSVIPPKIYFPISLDCTAIRCYIIVAEYFHAAAPAKKGRYFCGFPENDPQIIQKSCHLERNEMESRDLRTFVSNQVKSVRRSLDSLRSLGMTACLQNHSQVPNLFIAFVPYQ